MARRRSAGDGAIYQRKQDGRWVGVVEAGYTGGKRIRKAIYGKTQREVSTKLKKLQHEIEAGLRLGERQTVTQFLTWWLNDVVLKTRRTATYRAYGAMIRTHLIPTIGHIQLVKLTAEDVQHLVSVRLDAGVNPTTVAYAHRVLKTALANARRNGRVSRNVATDTELPEVETRPAVAMTPAQVGQFLESVQGDPWEALYHVAIFMGLRQGELRGLHWRSVDWEHQRIGVTTQATREGGHAAPKSAASVRTVAFEPEIAAVLRAHRARQLASRVMAGSDWDDQDLVFPNSIGRVQEPNVIRLAFQEALQRAGLPVMHFHDLRHTCASLMDGAGVTQRTAQAVLGHAHGQMTRAYMHVYDASKAAAVEAMQRIVDAK